MKRLTKWRRLTAVASRAFLLLAGVIGLSLIPDRSALASDNCTGPTECGEKSGVIPFHKDAIAASLIWKNAAAECPKMLIWMRPAEYKPKDYLNATVGGAFSGFNQKYIDLVQGGFGLGQLDRSGWSRYAPDLDRENVQLIDVCGLQEEIDKDLFTKTDIAKLTDADMSLTDPFFEDAGFSKGNGYNLFCAGNVAGVDGRIYAPGTHDKGGNNGTRKVAVFDPKREQWKPRQAPCVRTQFEQDPAGTAFDHCSALDENNTDPLLGSDMKYQRWYPTTVTLPDGRLLILSGSDQDTSVGPRLASSTKVRQAVPEVYDPDTDKTVALENAKKLLPMYPRAFVVQTGPDKKDWKVCTTGEVQEPLPLRPEDPGFGPGIPDINDYDPFIYNGKTSCLNVLAALADPERDVPAMNHWTPVATALNAHDSGASVMKVTINADGTWAQEVFAFGGSNNAEVAADGSIGNSPNVTTIERINYADKNPQWQKQGDLIQPATQNNPVALPDGKILIVGGRDGPAGNSLHYQLFDPATGSLTRLVDSPVPRHDHSTALLMPNGGVWVMGGNRVQLIAGGNPDTPEGRQLENLAVPVLEFYKPPYFFKGVRPIVKKTPHRIHYGQKFRITVAEKTSDIASVALLRTGPVTHNWAWGNHYVKLPFAKERTNKGRKDRLHISAPPLPGLAPAGDYLLFLVNKHGVPSEGQHIRLE